MSCDYERGQICEQPALDSEWCILEALLLFWRRVLTPLDVCGRCLLYRCCLSLRDELMLGCSNVTLMVGEKFDGQLPRRRGCRISVF